MLNDECYLFQIVRQSAFGPHVELFVYRSIRVKFFSCTRCGNSSIVEKSLPVDTDGKKIKESLKECNNELRHGYCCRKVEWKLSANNPRHINPGTILSDIAKDLVLNFQAVRSMSLSLKKIFQS
uniref:Uncharacterized protein n=1 Tax=Clytia hemisphaerica TaxID=252671 RepID=A0A7M5WV95_9CNID|eukprot:TCONS_00040125-protein